MPIKKLLSTVFLTLLTSISALECYAESSQPDNHAEYSTAEFVYRYLVGQVAGQRGDATLASKILLDLANREQNATLAEQATKAALYANQPQTAIEATNLWIKLDPTSEEAIQFTTQMLLAIGKLEEAKPYLSELLKKEPARANGFLFLNSMLAKQSDKQAVFSLVQDLAKPYPTLPEAKFTLAHSAWVAGNKDFALNELDAALKLKPEWSLAASLKAQILLEQSPDLAIQYYQSYLAQFPKADDVRLSYAKLLVNQKRFPEAKQEFVKIIKKADSDPELYVVIGLLEYQSQDYVAAEGYFKQALDHQFKDPEQIYLYLGENAEKQRNDSKAIEWYQKVPADDDHFIDAKIAEANVVARTQNVDIAIKLLDNIKYLTVEQKATAVQTQASLLSQAKRYQDSFDLLDKHVKNLPVTANLLYDYAMAAERINRPDISERELRKVIQIKPDFAQAYNALGYSLADRNVKLEEAKTYLEKALALSPDDYYILDSMGWLQYKMGKLDTAVDYLKRAYATQNDPEIAAHLGEVLWQQGKREEAVRTWKEASDQFPDNETLIKTKHKFQVD